MGNYSFYILLTLFLTSAAITWLAGITLTKVTSTLDTRFKLGDALGGLILLGIGGSLPEIAVAFGAARDGHISVIIGNILGGLAIQTLLVIIFDLAKKEKKPLSYLAGSKMLSLETFFPVIITAVVLLATWIPAKNSVFHMNPLSVFILLAWLAGIYVINKARKNKKLSLTAQDALPGRHHSERRQKECHVFYAKKKNWQVIGMFLLASVVILIAGVFLEKSGTAIADYLGISEGIFAATIIALATALPEISTGFESIFIGDNHLAVSDIMGGNAFMLTIFLMADVVSGQPVLSYAGQLDILIAVLGMVMMLVYAVSFLVRPKREYFRLGFDSILVLVIYILGMAGLSFIK